MTTPAIVLKTQFTLASAKGKGVQAKGVKFKDFVDYMDRKNTHAHENEFAGYQDYMSNEEKSTGLFTSDKDSLNDADKRDVKAIIQKAQKDKSIMWQDVISFDNEWLKEIGVLQTKDGEPFIDEVKLKQATRNAVNTMWKNEGIADSIYWTAAIHYNTDNIHVHVASVQTRDMRFRGKRKQGSLDKAKSVIAHTLIDRSKENEKLNDFIRNKVIGSMKQNEIMSLKNKVFDRSLVNQFKKIHLQLPSDKRTWKYGMNAMTDLRPELNRLTDMYIQRYYKDEFESFKKDLDKEVKLYERTYGSASRAQKYRETKMDDLYKRCGNTILQEMKTYDRKINMQQVTRKQNMQRANFQTNRAANQMLYRMNRLMGDNIEHIKNQREFERFEYEQEVKR